jgi:DNA polymerase I-like protein with 3'-5' exonuclease and polymerase domains
MHHALDPVDVHDLGTMLSLYIRHAYHKDEASDPTKLRKYANKWEAMQIYCGIDNCTQLELAMVLHDELQHAGRLEFYWNHYAMLLPALLDMMLGGIRTSRVARRNRYMDLRVECIDIQNELTALAGQPLHAKKDLSTKRVQKFLYETLGLPVQRKRGKRGVQGAVTADEITLRKLQIKYPTKTGRSVELILDHRRKAKLSTALTDNKTDDDGRLRCEYAPTTEAGRLASSKNPWETGTNLQNVDRETKDTYLPDEGHIFLECDLSQAESRVVYALSGSPRLIELACLGPDEYDDHVEVASNIFGTPTSEVTGEQRQIGKHTGHGAQRGLRGETMADRLLKHGYVRTPEECQRYLDCYHRDRPGVQVYDEQLNDALYRRAYSFLPQSEVADLLNQWGLRVAHHCCSKPQVVPTDGHPSRVVATVYDSVLLSCCPCEAYSLARVLNDSLQRPRTYQGVGGAVELTLPVEFKIGTTWKGSQEFKKLPSREEFEAAVKEIT